MTRPTRSTGIDGRQLRLLRRRERWSQADLAEKLAIHRVTLARWESNLVEPPTEAAERIAELFGIPREKLFQYDGEVEDAHELTDPWLKKVSLYKLQKYTRPALRALELSAAQLALRVDLPIRRFQELLDGEKPTTREIQLLRTSLGPDFNPTSILKKRILIREVDRSDVSHKLEVLLQHVTSLEPELGRLEAIEDRLKRVEGFQLDLLTKLDRVLKLLSENH